MIVFKTKTLCFLGALWIIGSYLLFAYYPRLIHKVINKEKKKKLKEILSLKLISKRNDKVRIRKVICLLQNLIFNQGKEEFTIEKKMHLII